MALIPALPKLKYCGLTRAEDVDAAIACGVDAIGLNFFEASPRCVGIEQARCLTLAIKKRVMAVGVFVNMAPDRVGEIVRACDLDCVQLHGDERPEWMARASSISSLRGISVIKAVSWRGTQEDREIVESWRLFAESQNEVNDPNVSKLIGFLVDSFDPIQRGGTGKTARWDLLYPRPPELQGVPILLAGGIREDNATESLQTAKPEGIDVASGIESAPGIKDKSKMQSIALAVLGYYRQKRLS